MSDFAFFRFASLNMLTEEEITHKNKFLKITEQVLDAEGMNVIQGFRKFLKDQLARSLKKLGKLEKRK